MRKLFVTFLCLTLLMVFGCSEDSPVESNDNSDIPADPGNVTMPATTINNIQPSANFSKQADNPDRIQVNLSGIINPVTGEAIQLVAQSNLFLAEDGVVQGLKVTKASTGNVLKADLVFVVDNSGSMNQEADSIATSIIKFSQVLQASGLDVRFAVVGYSSGVNGAINFTTAQTIETYLNRATGTARTREFAGADSAAFSSIADDFAPGISSENGIVGVLFADSNFSWRADAQRAFINFTDEPTQPRNLFDWSTENLCNVISGSATVHTVWSGSADTAGINWQTLQRERPWDMSACTGGTVVLINANGTGLDLSQLPVTGALSNSYLVEFVSQNSSARHTIVITIKENNADGKREFVDIEY